jgi:hypothetical protein
MGVARDGQAQTTEVIYDDRFIWLLTLYAKAENRQSRDIC